MPIRDEDKRWSLQLLIRVALLIGLGILLGADVLAQSVELLKLGVVKITSGTGDDEEQGTGIIVKLEQNKAYIATAAHVVDTGGPHWVTFYTDQQSPVSAEVLGLDAQNPKGLAALVVKGKLPEGLRALPLATTRQIGGGEEVKIIGFPVVVTVPWAVTAGSITGLDGGTLIFSGEADNGNSGGPLLINDQVIGIITLKIGPFGAAVPANIAEFSLKNWVGSLPPIETVDKPPKETTPMVQIPAGEFVMGSSKFKGFPNEYPSHRVSVAAFYLDKYEVSNQQFQRFVQETKHQTTAEQKGKSWAITQDGNGIDMKGANWRRPEGKSDVFEDGRADHPVVSISWVDAKAYCQWAGKRLPTEAEWEYAGRAGTQTQYWWGDDRPTRQVVNGADEANKREFPKKHPFSIMEGYDDGYSRTSPVDSFEPNPWGLHNMSGNVWEWVSDWYDEGVRGRFGHTACRPWNLGA